MLATANHGGAQAICKLSATANATSTSQKMASPQAQSLFKAAAKDLGTDWACDLFFAAEREYWQNRNHAGAVQYERQNRLGLGWANHDHHTYRSSRAAFPHLIATLELMGFQCRERFYAGREAGWGAQVIEQPQARVVIFADVDLSPEEVADDFAHQPLPDRDHLGTVGLWCELHGEAFLQAGMHHLEAQFDFDAARDSTRGRRRRNNGSLHVFSTPQASLYQRRSLADRAEALRAFALPRPDHARAVRSLPS